MTKVVNLKISTEGNQYPYEKHFSPEITLSELKVKLQLVVGTSADAMQMELRDKDGNFVAPMMDDGASLAQLGVEDGMLVHVKDSSGHIQTLMDPSMVDKYIMPEEQYDQLGDSVRAWKKREGLGRQSDQGLQEIENSKAIAEGIKVGSRCAVQLRGQPEKRGVVSFVGETSFRPGYWVGITYDEPVGKNDGQVEAHRYFTCMDKYGGFVKPKDVLIGDFPPLISDREMEEI